MKKPILFKRTRESVAKKLSNHIYIDIINSHDTKLIINNFTLLELIYIERILKKNRFHVRRRDSRINK